MTKKLLTALVLLSVVQASSAMAQAVSGKMVMEACKADIKHFCSTVAPGNGRIKACMKANLPNLSEPCKEALFQAWLNK